MDRKRGGLSPSTVRTYRVTANRLNAHAPGVRLDEINMPWRDGYVERFAATGVKQNTLWGELKTLRMLLNQAEGDGIATPGAHHSREWMPKKGKPETYYLKAEEVVAVEEVTLPDRLDRVRDLFLFACYTGLRFTDLTNLQPHDLDLGERVVTVVQSETGKRVSVPLNVKAVALVQKYDGPPPPLSNQKANQYFKELAHAAGLTRVVSKVKSAKRVPLHESIAFHDGRRTFATLAYLAGFPLAELAELTGHDTEKQLRGTSWLPRWKRLRKPSATRTSISLSGTPNRPHPCGPSPCPSPSTYARSER